MSWKVEPLKAHPVRTVFTLLFTLCASVFAILYIDNLIISLPLAAVFVYSMAPVFVTSSYKMTPRVISVKTPLVETIKPWEHFSALRQTKKAVILTPHEKRAFAGGNKGLTLLAETEEQIKKIADFAGKQLERRQNAQA